MSENEEDGGKHFVTLPLSSKLCEIHGLRVHQARGPQNVRTVNCEGRKAHTVNCAGRKLRVSG